MADEALRWPKSGPQVEYLPKALQSAHWGYAPDHPIFAAPGLHGDAGGCPTLIQTAHRTD
jgi:hypothetical protein